MYHDTIYINFTRFNYNDINFDYSFLISKSLKDKFSPINYGELLSKFNDIGFNVKYLKFNDIKEEETVYCTYNYQPNFNIFFSAYKKLFQNRNFNITFEYGVVINGKFYPNNMNTFASIYFQGENIKLGDHTETIIIGKTHKKLTELYQIVDKDANIIATEITDIVKDFEQHFFERYEVKLALRKYKLSRLKLLSSE
jgi:hypothetical protein